jgi:hypothetical protein
LYLVLPLLEFITYTPNKKRKNVKPMRIPKLPFHNVIGDLLYTLFFQGECIEYVTLEVNADAVASLSIPEHARYAMLVVESDPNQFNKDIVVRFREDGEAPSSLEGMPLGDFGVYEVKGAENMQRFKIIGTELGRQHKVRIQFFG